MPGESSASSGEQFNGQQAQLARFAHSTFDPPRTHSQHHVAARIFRDGRIDTSTSIADTLITHIGNVTLITMTDDPG